MKRHQAIYVKNIDSFSVYSEIVDILVSHYGWYRRDSIGHSIPCEMIYDLDDKYLYLSENFLFSNRLKYNIVSSYYACDFINITKQNNIIHQPKFKVGDRVKIDWYSLKKDNESRYNGLLHIFFTLPNEVTIVKDCKTAKNEYSAIIKEKHIVFEAKHLTLVESKPKCKFRDKETVNADMISIGWKIQGCTEHHEARINKIDSKFIHIKLLREGDYEAHFPIEDADQYIKKINKHKWSVGTYVEMLNTHPAYESAKKCDKLIFEIIYCDECRGIIDIQHDATGRVYRYSVSGISFEKQYKWHETKPEKKEFNGNLGYQSHTVAQGKWEEIDKFAEDWSNEERERLYGSGDFDDATSQDTVDFMKCQPYPVVPNADWKIKDVINCFNETGLLWSTSAESKDHRDILSKPEITISKVKEIDIDINKPKI